MTKQEIIDDSYKLINAKSEISKLQNSISGYQNYIITKYEEDLLNRKSFLKINSLIAGMTLEFRNIYGIQAPYYEIADTHLAIDYDGDGVTSEEDWLKVDGSTTIRDCPEMVCASSYSTDVETGLDKLKAADQQRFFVDSKKRDKSSNFFRPFCPPGMNRWSGTFLHNYICKPYELTEEYLYSLITKSQEQGIPTISQSFSVTGFDYNNQICCYIDSTSKIVRHNYQYNVADEDLSDAKFAGKNCYNIPNGAEDLSPIKYYDASTSITDKVVVKYYFTQTTPSEAFCYGYGILVPDEDDNSKFYLDLLTQTGQVKSTEAWMKMYRNNGWMWGWATDYARPWTISGDYIAIFEPIDFSTTEKLYEIKKHLMLYYKSMLEEVLQYYDYYFDNGGSDVISTKQSIVLMNNIIDKVKEFVELQTSENFLKVLNALNERMKFVYNTDVPTVYELPAYRANSINVFMQKNQSMYNDLYSILDGRLNKRIGTLEELYNTIQNTNVAMQAMTAKKTNYSNLSKDIVGYTITNGFGTNDITIKLETWETDMSFLSQMVRLSKAYIIDDAEHYLETRILDIEKILDLKLSDSEIKPEEATTEQVVNYATFKIKLLDIVDESFKDNNPRIVRTIMNNTI